MNYSQRLSLTLALSLSAHVAIIALWRPEPFLHVVPEEPRPVAVQLRDESLEYIDIAVPADTPPEDADHIAVEDAIAMDETPADEDAPTPDVSGPEAKEPDTVDVPPRPEPAPPEPEPAPPEPEPAPEEEAERMEIARAVPPQPPAPVEPSETPSDDVADAPPEQPEPMPPRDLRAAPRRRTVTHGMTNFEALRHEIAPYLKHIRDKVERHWIEALLMRYTGTSPTRAEVFCAIAPDGTLVEARIVGMADDAIFAAICRDAIERAAPFDPFPFETPDIYRNKNLEINWHFSFL